MPIWKHTIWFMMDPWLDHLHCTRCSCSSCQ